ncbi:unnamed protein product (macronuclear) [Paramecium tetraurelia]|uniref:Uncharacterized protein n=1 Tax=Paramecium tetraurelia TaxID=5888 RepID=A0BNF6_PARTE|nr:uncharacterized protein GSPATT00030711001 [Paramecium tetraurelia]CAK60073.1 unnamed protein product [Paramecium tetraurelia]|eukprot:XP_001427471.1 hypothetical protein (macronuclear) [Paramecium tetraurelia strain d4-2]
MGCGASKEIEKQIEEYQVKIDEIQDINAILIQQINELKENKNKRKPVYVVADQEIDDLFVFKTDLDKRFEQIDTDIKKIRIQLLGSEQCNQKQPNEKKQTCKQTDDASSENKWLEMMENNDNEITLKHFQDPILDDLSEKLDQNGKEQSKEKIENLEMKKTIPKQQQEQKPVQDKQANISELSKQLADALGEDMKQVHDGMKSKLFYNTGGNQSKEIPSNNQSNIQVSIPNSSNANLTNTNNNINNNNKSSRTNAQNINTPRTDQVKRKSTKSGSQVDKGQANSQQHFFSKQSTEVIVAKKKTKKG